MTAIGAAKWEKRENDISGEASRVRLADDLHRRGDAGPCAAPILSTYRPSIRALRELVRHRIFEVRETGQPLRMP